MQIKVKVPQPNPLQDAMPLRDALRGLRHAVRRGGETLLEAMPVDALPRPAAALAEAVLREVGEFAKGVNQMASGLARLALGAGSKPQGSLQDLTAQTGAEDGFARGMYAALRAVLSQLNAPSVYISETAARSAYLAMTPAQRVGSDASIAAVLSLEMAASKVVRGASAADAAQVPGHSLDHVAIFAVMLWLQSNRSEAEDEAALQAATDLAVALAVEADEAFRAKNVAGLSKLYTEFASHV